MSNNEKSRRTVTLSRDNDEWLAEKDNVSAYIDRLVTHARQTGDPRMAHVSLQEKQTERQLDEAESTVARLKQELTEIQELKEQLNNFESAELQEAREELQDVPKEPTNPAIKNWANKLDMNPAELVDELD